MIVVHLREVSSLGQSDPDHIFGSSRSPTFSALLDLARSRGGLYRRLTRALPLLSDASLCVPLAPRNLIIALGAFFPSASARTTPPRIPTYRQVGDTAFEALGIFASPLRAAPRFSEPRPPCPTSLLRLSPDSKMSATM